jgi:alkylation response protein AidB-like acyl-CoA dehydrogenase
MGFRGGVSAEVIMEDLRVPKEDLLGQEGEGFNILVNCLNVERLWFASMALGVSQGALDYALRYAKERVQFGKPIAEFQGIQFMLADMAIQIETGRSITYKASSQIDHGIRDVSSMSAIAKCFASDAAMKVTTDAVQILGGYGYMKDYPVERMMRDAKATQIAAGTNQIQRVLIARSLLGK